MFVLQKTGGVSGKVEYQSKYKNGQIEFAASRSNAKVWQSLSPMELDQGIIAEKRREENWVKKRIAEFPHVASLKYSIIEISDLEAWIEGKEEGVAIA
jgi:hypothetical protein